MGNSNPLLWTASLAGALALSACGGGADSGVKDPGGSGSTGTTTDTDDSGGGSGTGATEAGCLEQVPVVEVGTGEREFEEMADGDGVVMVHGPQGGWHMLGSVRATHMTEIVSVHFTITHTPSGTIVADNTYRVATVYDPDTCVGYYPGMYGYLYVEALEDGELNTPPELMSYDDMTMCMTVTDQDMREGTDCRAVVAVPDPADIEDGLVPDDEPADGG